MLCSAEVELTGSFLARSLCHVCTVQLCRDGAIQMWLFDSGVDSRSLKETSKDRISWLQMLNQLKVASDECFKMLQRFEHCYFSFSLTFLFSFMPSASPPIHGPPGFPNMNLRLAQHGRL